MPGYTSIFWHQTFRSCTIFHPKYCKSWTRPATSSSAFPVWTSTWVITTKCKYSSDCCHMLILIPKRMCLIYVFLCCRSSLMLWQLCLSTLILWETHLGGRALILMVWFYSSVSYIHHVIHLRFTSISLLLQDKQRIMWKTELQEVLLVLVALKIRKASLNQLRLGFIMHHC